MQQGAAIGGGVGLVAVCDIAICAPDSRFGLSEVKLGILPAVISPYVIGKIGPSHARALFMTGERFDAERALRIGLVHRVAEDLDAEAARYEAAIAASGGVDIQILGIGSDGHVGFNEPMSSLASRTRIKTLTQQTRQDNARFFTDPAAVPDHVLTQGLGTILEARHLLLLAMGEAKAGAVAAAVEGPVAALCPASALQLHPHVTVLVDEAAASMLAHRAYYQDTFGRKPSWQGL